MSVSVRLQKIMDYYKINSGELARKIGVQKSSISHVLSGRNKPSYTFLSKLIKAFPEINLKWFISGEGEMITEHKVVKNMESFDDTEKHTTTLNDRDKKINKEQVNNPNQIEIENLIIVYNDNTFKLLNKKRD